MDSLCGGNFCAGASATGRDVVAQPAASNMNEIIRILGIALCLQFFGNWNEPGSRTT
jgi:hypothetical protein